MGDIEMSNVKLQRVPDQVRNSATLTPRSGDKECITSSTKSSLHPTG